MTDIIERLQEWLCFGNECGAKLLSLFEPPPRCVELKVVAAQILMVQDGYSLNGIILAPFS